MEPAGHLEADGGGVPRWQGQGDWRVELERAVPGAPAEDVDRRSGREPGKRLSNQSDSARATLANMFLGRTASVQPPAQAQGVVRPARHCPRGILPSRINRYFSILCRNQSTHS